MVTEMLNASLTPAVIGIDAVAQRAGLDPKYTPVLSVVAGIALECAALYYSGTTHPNYANGAVVGVLIGAGAVGLNLAALAGVNGTKSALRASTSTAKRLTGRNPKPASPIILPDAVDPLQE